MLKIKTVFALEEIRAIYPESHWVRISRQHWTREPFAVFARKPGRCFWYVAFGEWALLSSFLYSTNMYGAHARCQVMF